MCEFIVVGLVRGCYVKNGVNKPFTRLYCSYELDNAKYSSADVCGLGCDVIFIGKIIDDVHINDVITPVYNKHGTCLDIIIHKERIN